MAVPTLHVVASVLAWMSSVINPFIYAFKNRQYKQAFKKVCYYFLEFWFLLMFDYVTVNFSIYLLISKCFYEIYQNLPKKNYCSCSVLTSLSANQHHDLARAKRVDKVNNLLPKRLSQRCCSTMQDRRRWNICKKNIFC